MIAQAVPWKEIEFNRDCKGRRIMVTCYDKMFTFVSLYAPNLGQGDFAIQIVKRIG